MSRKAGVHGDFTRSREGWNSSYGDFSELEYEGDEAYIRSLFTIFRGDANVLDVDWRQEGTFYVLTVRLGNGLGNNDDPVVTIRQQINRVEKSIFEPPFNLNITDEEARIIREALDNPKEGQSPALTNPDAIKLYLLGLAGVKTRQVNQPIISVTRSAQRGHQWADQTQWVGYNLSHAQMIANAGIGGVLNFALPLIPGTGQVRWNGLLLYYGWIKQEPFYDTSSADRSVEYLSYEFGLWPNVLHELATF